MPRDDRHKDQVLVWGVGEFGDSGLFGLYLGPLERSCAFGAAATPAWTTFCQFGLQPAVGISKFGVASPSRPLR